MNRAFVVLQERAAVILSYRPQRNDGYATGGANVHGAVFPEKVSVGELQLLGHFENIPGRQDDVRPVDAASVSYTHLDVYKRQVHYRHFA